MECGTPAEALASLLEQGILVNLDSFRQAWNLQADRFSTGDIADARCFDAEGGQWIVSLARWGLAEKELLTCLDSWHAEHPLESGIKATLLRKKLSGICEVPLVMAVLSTSLRRGVSVLSEGLIHRADFKPAVSPLTEKYWPGVQNFLQQRGIRLPLLSEISSETGLETETVQALAGEAMRYGRLRKLSDRRYAQPAQLLELATLVNALADEGEPITAISLKSRMGTGRNLAVEVLEYFDTIRFTLRREDHRVVLDRDLPGRLFSG
jgi:selenocysteine-specific elongation factor